jgi:hypothetical protein
MRTNIGNLGMFQLANNLLIYSLHSFQSNLSLERPPSMTYISLYFARKTSKSTKRKPILIEKYVKAPLKA